MKINSKPAIFFWGSLLYSLFLLLLTATMSSCTHPDGDIGSWGGTWLIEKIEINGVEDTGYGVGNKDRSMISFQGGIFCIAQIDGPEMFGHWSEKDNIVVLDGSFGVGTLDKWPSNLGFGPDLTVSLVIEDRTSKKMVWSLDCQDLTRRTYYLRKI